MRDLTKSIFSFSWAMSLFGAQQAMNMVSPRKATKAFEEVTGATQEQFDGITKATFRAGDNLQKGLVDLTFGVFSLQALNPSRWMRMTSDIIQQSADIAQQGLKATSSVVQESAEAGGQNKGRASPGGQPVGWGPVK